MLMPIWLVSFFSINFHSTFIINVKILYFITINYKFILVRYLVLIFLI
nr:hypothetical protein Itr_chr12CG26790 [Ipomoea trifida]